MFSIPSNKLLNCLSLPSHSSAFFFSPSHTHWLSFLSLSHSTHSLLKALNYSQKKKKKIEVMDSGNGFIQHWDVVYTTLGVSVGSQHTESTKTLADMESII